MPGKYTIGITPHGFFIAGGRPRFLAAALAQVVQSDGELTCAKVTTIAELLAVELRAMDFDVAFAIPEGHVLVHACGARFTPEHWQARTARRNPCPNVAGTGTGFNELRKCSCGSDITLASFALECDHAPEPSWVNRTPVPPAPVGAN